MMVEGVIERLMPGGLGRLASPQGSILLPHVVEGDVVRATITGQRRGVLHGTVKDILQPSPERCVPPCPVAGQCGGCALQHITPSHHIQVKMDWVRRAFSAVDHDAVDWISMTHANEQRRRVRWHVDVDGRLGFYARESHEVIHTASCLAIVPALQELFKQWPKLHTVADTQPDALYAVVLDDGIHAVLEYNQTPKTMPTTTTITHVGSLPVQWWWSDKQVCRPLHRPVSRFHDAVPAGANTLLLAVGPDDFVQGNRAGNQMMVQQVQDWCGRASRVVDLFSGVGNISLPLAQQGKEVVGFEMNPASVRAANATAKELKLHAHYTVADLMGRALQIPDAMSGAGCLILDPPRKGAKQLCRQLHRLLPQSIIMIHCDPYSASRDALMVEQQGFQLKAVRGLDLFPGSGHVECMSYWQR